MGNPGNSGRRTVFRDVVEVVSSDNDSAGHFGGDNFASQDTAADRHFTGEGALLVCTQRSASGRDPTADHAPI